jgi:DNA-directed RNA polymerase subunit RPC12/RpoP
MADDPIRSQLADTALAADLRRWRRAHPDATLTEIEQALDARLDAARAGLLAEVAGDIPDEEERCPECGERLARRGTRTRTLRTRGDVPLELTRAYLRCPACGAGVSPPR